MHGQFEVRAYPDQDVFQDNRAFRIQANVHHVFIFEAEAGGVVRVHVDMARSHDDARFQPHNARGRGQDDAGGARSVAALAYGRINAQGAGVGFGDFHL